MITLRIRVGTTYPVTQQLIDPTTNMAMDLSGVLGATVTLTNVDTGAVAATMSAATGSSGNITFTMATDAVAQPTMYTEVVSLYKNEGIVQWPTQGEQGIWVF